MENIIVNCQGLIKSFGSTRVVDGLDLTLARGEILCLLGPSGCGKTTTLRLIAGLEDLDEGVITVRSKVVASKKIGIPAENRNIGIVFQDYALFPHMSVERNIGYGLRKAINANARVAELLDLVGLEGLGSRMPYELSGGQQQRVALARALAPRPEVLLLDEPFSNLDATLRKQLRMDVRRILREAESSAIFVTHDQEEALSISDRIAVMWDGRILQNASPHEVYQHPATREVARFVGEVNLLPAEVSRGKIQCELGSFAMEAPINEGNGDLEVMFWPEVLEIREAKNGRGKVMWREYFGHDQLVQVQLPSGSLLLVRSGSQSTLSAGCLVDIDIKGKPVVYQRFADQAG